MPLKRKGQMQKACTPKKDYSRNLSVRMTEEQYQRLRQYMKLARLNSTAYFCRLIREDEFKGRFPELNRAMHASVNMIYSNVLQISRHQRARVMDTEAIGKLVFLADRLCEEIYLLAGQK